MRFSTLVQTLAVTAVAVSSVSTAWAQDLAGRVARAPDGDVRVQFASRSGTCGDGRDAIGFRKAFFGENFQSMGNWNAPTCVPGPVRVVLSVAGGQVTRIKTSVGGAWARTTERLTDIGVVSPVEASSYFFGLVPRIERVGSRDKSRILLPAVLADAGDVVPQLTSLARDDARVNDTRRQAIIWLGLLGDSRVIPTLVAFARGSGAGPVGGDIDDNDEKPGKKGLGTTAMAALTEMENGIGVPSLIELARNSALSTRSAAVFWLGQTEDPRAFATLHRVIENRGEDDRVRAHAVFSLGQAAREDPSQLRYLQSIYAGASSRMKEQIFLTMGQDKSGGSSWLLEKARDRNESVDVRRKALFWAGQNEDTPTRDLASIYRSSTDESLKEHAIFVLSQRKDEAALNELMRIAQSDPDRQMRAKALFWLGQSDDPRVAKLIADKIAK
ncbi:MAG TPA: HEAT repeat domain-containing protein [Gemmatimonadaceae bacterium]|nr:HEAT repeat domain-containing protein [Gemmatimonadaceae bacterium]